MAVWIFYVYLKASTPPPHNGFTRWDGGCGGDEATAHSRFPLGITAHTLVYTVSNIYCNCIE